MIDRREGRSTVVTWLVVAALGLVLVLGGGPQAAAEPAPDPAPADTAPAETPDTTPPAEPEQPEQPEESDDGSSFPWGVVLAIAVVLVAVAALLTWSSDRSDRRRRATVTVDQRLDGLISRCRWAVDHGVYAVLQAPDAATRASAWVALDAQLRSVETDIARATGPLDPDAVSALARLGSAIAAMRGTLAGAFQSQGTSGEAALDATVAESTARAVLARRDDVDRALLDVERTRR